MKRWRGLRPLGIVLGATLPAILFAWHASAQAPIAPPGIRIRAPLRVVPGAMVQAGDEESALDGVFLPPDRQIKRRLELAGEMIEAERYGEAVRLIGSLLEGPEDFFYKPDPDQPVFSSLKAEAGRLLAKLPPAGRESYELQFGARARQQLQEAAAAGDLSAVADVSRRFFYTQAGAEATYLIGRHFLDQNRPQAAAVCFERILELPEAAARLEPALSLSLATCWLQAGKPDLAVQALVAFRSRFPAGRVKLGGKDVPLFAGEGQALAWMQQHLGKLPQVTVAEQDQWVLFRGDERRNAMSVGGQPLLSLRWRQRTCDDAKIEEFVAKLRSDYLGQGVAALPSMHPLAVSDVVLMRTAFALQAVDFETGKLVWKYSVGGDPVEQLLQSLASRQSGGATQQLLAGLDGRMWEDNTYGTLASDGEQVYYIEDLGLAGVNSNTVMTVLPNGQRRYSSNSRGTNRLAARELRTQGKLKWTVGGQNGEDEPRLAGTFFLGPPLPLMGQLYALAEFKGQEIRLVALDPKTGQLQWSQQLAVVDPPVTADMVRRNAGITPSYADSVLVCPTASGAVVALDLSSRSLLWGYQYPRGGHFLGGQPRFNLRASIYAGSQQRSVDHWADSSITIADGRVIITPVETNELFCLNLADGKELWRQPRGSHLYVACVHDGKLILVGQNAVSAITLADGTRAWPDVHLRDGAVPSGRGYYTGQHYFLPLSSAQVARIDLAAGKIVDYATSRSGSIPGNLICYRDAIISQGPDYVDAYYQFDALKERIEQTLAKTPDDARSLAALGEIRLHEGQLAEAVDLFRRAYEIDADPGTRAQLVDALLSGLREDFAAYRGSLNELDQLVEQPRHRIELLRLRAAGLQQMGEIWPSFEAYLKLLDEQGLWEVDEVQPRLSVRRDRWLREQFARLRSAADEETRQRIDAVTAARLEEALKAGSSEALRLFASVFGLQPAARDINRALAQSLSPDELLEQNLLLEDQILSEDDAVAGPATALMAEMLRAGNRSDLAAIYYRQLNTRFADVPCLEGKTGRQLVEALPPADLARRLLADVSWPTGKVAAHEEKGGTRNARIVRPQRATSLEVVGPRGLLFRDVSLTLQMDSQQQLVAEDSLGNPRFSIQLAEQGVRRAVAARNAYSVPSISYASVHGGLVVLSVGTQIMAIDTLRSGDSLANRVLWTEDLNDQIGGLANMQSVVPRAVSLKWGGTRFVPEDGFGRRYGTIGPVTANGVFFQRLNDLYCVDPLSGKPIWVRHDVPLGVDLFGDHEYLIAAPAGKSGKALVLRAATGELVATREIPQIEDRMATFDRNLLVWRSAADGQRMEMRDLVSDEVLWEFDFAAGSRASVVGRDVVGVFQPDGDFTLVRLANGQPVTRQKLETEKLLIGIHILPWQGGYLLATHTAPASNNNRSAQPYPVGPDCPMLTGRVYAFDRDSGKPLWPAPVSVSQHGLPLNQPRDLPVLVLMRQMAKPGPISSRDPRLSVMCIDKRTGEVVYHKDDLQGTTVSSCVMSADPAKATVKIALPNQVIELAYSKDAEVPNEVGATDEQKQAAAKIVLEGLGFGPGEPSETPPTAQANPKPGSD
jgi:outer membrane protein assembly factor BamB